MSKTKPAEGWDHPVHISKRAMATVVQTIAGYKDPQIHACRLQKDGQLQVDIQVGDCVVWLSVRGM